jgi:hypothetical protein
VSGGVGAGRGEAGLRAAGVDEGQALVAAMVHRRCEILREELGSERAGG